MDITIINIINTIIIYSIHASKIVPIVTYNLLYSYKFLKNSIAFNNNIIIIY